MMLRSLLSLAVLSGFIQAPNPPTILTNSPNPTFNLYLPMAINADPFVDVFTDGVVDYQGYPGEICIFGHVISAVPKVVYSVTLAIDVTVSPYCWPDACPPYSETHYAEPMLEATLPDQVNPFSYCLVYGKGGYSYGAAKLASASLNSPDGRVIYPLTVTNWTKEVAEWETTVYGTVRNNSGHRLAEIRVVGIAGTCSAKEADLESTTLKPGKETSFIFNRFFCQGSAPVVEISAQGVAEP